MPPLRTGVDLIEIVRIAEAIEQHGQRFLHRVFTAKELAEVGDSMPSLAARFAAKEAVAKALGTGFGQVTWCEVEILRGPCREPVLHLHGEAARQAEHLGLKTWAVSLSHTKDYAVASVVALGDEAGTTGR